MHAHDRCVWRNRGFHGLCARAGITRVSAAGSDSSGGAPPAQLSGEFWRLVLLRSFAHQATHWLLSPALLADALHRRFAVNGAIRPDISSSYFLLPPKVDALLAHIAAKTFFLLHGPRGTGKTTTALHALAAAAGQGCLPAVVDLSTLDKTSSSTFWTELHAVLAGWLDEAGVKLMPFTDAATFQRAFLRNQLGDDKLVVVMFNEFDVLDAPGVVIKNQVSRTRSSMCKCFTGCLRAKRALPPFVVYSF